MKAFRFACMMALAAALSACIPAHSYEETYEMVGYTPNALKDTMLRSFRLVEVTDSANIRESEVPLYLSDSLQAMTLITQDTLLARQDSARGTYLTLRMIMWEDGAEITPQAGVRLFEQKVVEPLKRKVNRR